MKGKVYLVGAGPGDIGLVSLRAKQLIETADVIVYDRLINETILNFAKSDCKKIDAGKESGHHKIRQNKIEEILAKYAQRGKIVVRLKGGDPYLFGRGSEEALYLKNKKIEFEVVPGISSAVAGPSYAGIPVTHRDLAYCVTFITGHRALRHTMQGSINQKNKLDLDWENLAKNKGTLVFLMGIKNLHSICGNLIKFGKDKNTLVSVVRCATFTEQKKVIGTLSNITEKTKKAKITSPGIIIIGDVVSLSEKLDWFSKKHLPLRGKTIIIPRAKENQGALKDNLEALGAKTISFPVIKHKPVKNKNIRKILADLSNYDYLIFTSPTTIEFLIKELEKLNLDIRSLCGPKICVIGPGTAKSLEKYHLKVSIIPKNFIAEGLISVLRKESLKNKKLFIIRSENARQTLPEELRRAGGIVDVLNIYKTVINKPPKSAIKYTADLIKNKQADLVIFMSGTQVKNFYRILQNYVDTKNLNCICIGPETEKHAKQYGFKTIIKTKEYSLSGIIKAIENYYESSTEPQ